MGPAVLGDALSIVPLVVAFPLAVFSLRHHLILSLCQLVVTSPLLVHLLRRPLVLSSRRLVVVSPLDVPPSHRLIVLDVPPSHRLFVSFCHPLLVLSRQLNVASSLIVLSLCRSLVLSSCRLVVAFPLIAPPLILLSCQPSFTSPSPCHSPSPMPSNTVTVKCCHRHRTPPPLPQLNAVSIVHCPPLPRQSSITTVKNQCHQQPSPDVATDQRWCQSPSLP